MTIRSSILSLTTGSALLFASGALAQDISPCGTDEIRQQMIAENPDLLHKEAEYELGLQAYLQARAGMRDDSDNVVYVLPLVFHILYDPTLTPPNDLHNISDAQIFNAVNILNRDYAKMNADTTQICCGYNAIAAKTRIQFQLATKDPFGNCTNGIDRITSQRSTNGGNFSKLNPWFRQSYINIWVVRSLASTGFFAPAGFSQLPADVQDDNGALRDGVILLHDYTGDTGTSNTFTSRTLTHEIGHFLNLKHTWGGTNAPGISCGDDGVPDTPITKGHQTCYLYDSFCSWQPTDTAYTFNDVTTTSGTTDPSPVPTVYVNDTLEPGLTLSPFTAVGVSSNSSEDGAFAFSLWNQGASQGDSAFSQLTGSLNLLRYYEFTVTPEEGKSMTLSNISFRVDRSSTGPRTFSVRSSAGSSPFQSNLPASIIPSNPALSVASSNTFFFNRDTTGMVKGAKVSLTGNDYMNVPGPITFRIYAWNAEEPDGYFSVDSVSVNGVFGIIENVQNYMEYSYCTHMFTEGQRDRMRATLNSSVSSRSNLWTDANHAYTGTDGYEQTCGPQAEFYPMKFFACPGTPIQFKDNSSRATPTSWAWTFDGGNPATSNDQDPSVSFDTPGPHSVTLTVGNDFGSSSLTKEGIVYIGANYSETDGLLSEPFDTEERFSKWPIINFENNATRWSWDSQTGHDAPGCAKLNASNTYTLVQDGFFWNNFSDKDELVTPTLDLSYLSSITLKFWYAYAARTTVLDNVTESLDVWSSNDCGGQWLQRAHITGGDLITAGIQLPGYTPGASDWREVIVTFPTMPATDHVRFKFVYSSGLYSNDIFVDDINMSAVVGIDELAQSGSMSLMPNPASNSLTVVMDLAGSPSGTLSFLDMTGRTVYSQGVNAGGNQLEFDLDKMGLTSGVYLVRLKHANGQRIERLVVR